MTKCPTVNEFQLNPKEVLCPFPCPFCNYFHSYLNLKEVIDSNTSQPHADIQPTQTNLLQQLYTGGTCESHS